MRVPWGLLIIGALLGCGAISGEPDEDPKLQRLADGEPCADDAQCRSDFCWLGKCYATACDDDSAVCREGYRCSPREQSCHPLLGCSYLSQVCFKTCRSDEECGFGYDCDQSFCKASDKPLLTVPEDVEAGEGVPITLRVKIETPQMLSRLEWCFENITDCRYPKIEELVVEPDGPHGGTVYVSDVTYTFKKGSTSYYVKIKATGSGDKPTTGVAEAEKGFTVSMCHPAGASCWPDSVSIHCCSGLTCVAPDENSSGRCQ